jgi:hypothetical protein
MYLKVINYLLKLFIGLPPVITGEKLEINNRIDNLLEPDCRRKEKM